MKFTEYLNESETGFKSYGDVLTHHDLKYIKSTKKAGKVTVDHYENGPHKVEVWSPYKNYFGGGGWTYKHKGKEIEHGANYNYDKLHKTILAHKE